MSKARAIALKISVMGPQGSGKTTQAKLLVQYLNAPIVMTGEAMRQLAETDTPEGRQVKNFLDKGQMVPDEIVAGYVSNTLKEESFQNGFVMDGYPRSLSQIKLFDPHFDRVFYLDINDHLAVQRLLKRGREDDTLPLIKERLKLYHERTKPMLRFYEQGHILKRIDGNGTVEQVQERIREGLHV